VEKRSKASPRRRCTLRPKGRSVSGEAPLLRRRLRFTTSYHTQFRAVSARALPHPHRLLLWALHRFHGAAVRCMVSTQSFGTSCRRAASRIWPPGGAAWIRISSKPGAKDFLSLPARFASLRRPCRVGEEHRGVPPHAVGWQQTGDRRRPGTRAGCKACIRERRSRGFDLPRILRAPCCCRRHGLSKPHGYVRDW